MKSETSSSCFLPLPFVNSQLYLSSYSSAANTFETDWAALEYNQEPNHVKIERYLSKGVPKEEWEDEVLNEMMQRRRASFIPKTL